MWRWAMMGLLALAAGTGGCSRSWWCLDVCNKWEHVYGVEVVMPSGYRVDVGDLNVVDPHLPGQGFNHWRCIPRPIPDMAQLRYRDYTTGKPHEVPLELARHLPWAFHGTVMLTIEPDGAVRMQAEDDESILFPETGVNAIVGRMPSTRAAGSAEKGS